MQVFWVEKSIFNRVQKLQNSQHTAGNNILGGIKPIVEQTPIIIKKIQTIDEQNIYNIICYLKYRWRGGREHVHRSLSIIQSLNTSPENNNYEDCTSLNRKILL